MWDLMFTFAYAKSPPPRVAKTILYPYFGGCGGTDLGVFYLTKSIMLYTITINQEAAIRSGLPLKVQHLAVIAVLKNMFASPDVQEVWHDGRSYKWVAIQVICNELPLFDFEKRRVSGLLSELEDMAVIMRHPQNQQLRKSFFRAGASWNNLFSTMQKIADPSMQKNAEGYAKNCIDTMQKIADNQTTINQTTINKKDIAISENLPLSVIENRKKALSTPESLPPFDSEAFGIVWAQWQKHLAQKGYPATGMQLEIQGQKLRAITTDEATASKIIAQAIEGGYSLFKPLKAEKVSTPHQGAQRPAYGKKKAVATDWANFDANDPKYKLT